MTYRSIYWNDNEARLKSFSSTTKSDAASVVKIEISVRDPFRLGMLLEALSEIKRAEAEINCGPLRTNKKQSQPLRTTRDISDDRPLLLTYRKE